MSSSTVRALAEQTKSSAEQLLALLQEAGVSVNDIDAMIGPEDKNKWLAHLEKGVAEHSQSVATRSQLRPERSNATTTGKENGEIRPIADPKKIIESDAETGFALTMTARTHLMRALRLEDNEEGRSGLRALMKGLAGNVEIRIARERPRRPADQDKLVLWFESTEQLKNIAFITVPEINGLLATGVFASAPFPSEGDCLVWRCSLCPGETFGEPIPKSLVDAASNLTPLPASWRSRKRNQSREVASAREWSAFLEVQEALASSASFTLDFDGFRFPKPDQPEVIEFTLSAGSDTERAREQLLGLRQLEQLSVHDVESDGTEESATRQPETVCKMAFLRAKKGTLRARIDEENAEAVVKGRIQLPQIGRITYEPFGQIYAIQLQKFALDRLAKANAANPRLESILFGAEEGLTIRSAPDCEPVTEADCLDKDRINVDQRHAVAMALQAPDAFFLQGPPGTGKTTFIAELCHQAASRGWRVLVTSQANLAVDNALSRLQSDPKILPIRLADRSKVSDEAQAFVGEQAIRTWLQAIASQAESRAASARLVVAIDPFFSANASKIRDWLRYAEGWETERGKLADEIDRISCEVWNNERFTESSDSKLKTAEALLIAIERLSASSRADEVEDAPASWQGCREEGGDVWGASPTIPEFFQKRWVSFSNPWSFRQQILKFRKLSDSRCEIERLGSELAQGDLERLRAAESAIEFTKAELELWRSAHTDSLTTLKGAREALARLNPDVLFGPACQMPATGCPLPKRWEQFSESVKSARVRYQETFRPSRGLFPSRNATPTMLEIALESWIRAELDGDSRAATSHSRQAGVMFLFLEEQQNGFFHGLSSMFSSGQTDEQKAFHLAQKALATARDQYRQRTTAKIKGFNPNSPPTLDESGFLTNIRREYQHAHSNAVEVVSTVSARCNKAASRCRRLESKQRMQVAALGEVAGKIEHGPFAELNTLYRSAGFGSRKVDFSDKPETASRKLEKILSHNAELLEGLETLDKAWIDVEAKAKGAAHDWIAKTKDAAVQIRKTLTDARRRIQRRQEKLQERNNSDQQARTLWAEFAARCPELSDFMPNETVPAQVSAAMELWEAKKSTAQARIAIVEEWRRRLVEESRTVIPPDLVHRFHLRANVIGCTCLYAGRKDFRTNYGDRPFDLVIVDEVSKAAPTELLVPCLLGERLVFVGDHKQLPPMIDQGEESFEDAAQELDMVSDELRERLGRSLFMERFEALQAGETNLTKTLVRQYRMHSSIMQAINQFYDGQLLPGYDSLDADRRHSLIAEPWLSADTHFVWLDVPFGQNFAFEQRGSSRVNPFEVEVVARVLRDIEPGLLAAAETDVPLRLGITSVYASQVNALEDRVPRSLRNSGLVRRTTVDQFQGMERDVMILSLVLNQEKGRDGKLVRPSHFLQRPERLNVALSRARRLLIVVGCSHSYTRQQFPASDQYNQVLNCARGKFGKYLMVKDALF